MTGATVPTRAAGDSGGAVVCAAGDAGGTVVSAAGDASGTVVSAAGTGAVVFDIGRVLIRWDLRHLFAKLIADPGELDWFVTTVVTPEWHFQHDAGRPLDEMVAERIAQFPDQRARIEAYAARFPETIPGPITGMEPVVEALHGAGVPLYALTNFGAEFWDLWSPDWRLKPLFGDILVSGVERLAKPDPAVYRLAAERFGIDPAASLFIDDNADNIAAARALGWGTHLFDGAEGAVGALVRAGWLPEGWHAGHRPADASTLADGRPI